MTASSRVCRLMTCACDAEAGEDDYVISCLLMVFIAVALPRLARTDNTSYKAALEGSSTVHLVLRSLGSPTVDGQAELACQN